MTADDRTFIIAEAGVNHNGDLELARRLIDVAHEAGADAVKFQTFRAERLLNRSAPKAEYQARATGNAESQFEMIRKLELSDAAHEVLVAHAMARGIAFMSTPFDEISLELLTSRFGLQLIKVPSGEITNAPFLLGIARAAQRVILSTGMSTLAEIEDALGIMAYGFVASEDGFPDSAGIKRCFSSTSGQRALRERVTLLHCSTEYPAPPMEVNLRAMNGMRAAFGLPVGYSDHTEGIHISLAAVALGARVIEKHFTLDRKLPGPDHHASLEPSELQLMVTSIRAIEMALGDGVKRATESEWKNRTVARRSIVAARPIIMGERLTPENLTCKRPGGGLSPMEFWRVVGRSASRAYAVDEPVDE